MDYGIIVKRSFEFAWRHKLLWIFGLFIMGLGSLNLEFGASPFTQTEAPAIDPMAMHPELILPFLGAYFLIVVLSMITYCISAPALVDAANRLGRGGEYSFSASFSTGVDFFFRSLGLMLVIAMIALAMMVVLVIIPIVIIVAMSAGAGDSSGNAPLVIILVILAILVGIPVLMALVWVMTTIHQLAMRAMVVRDIGIIDSLAEGWYLLKHNFGKCVVIFLIYMGFAMGLGILLFILFAIIKLVVSGALVPQTSSLAVIFILNLLAGLPFSIVIGGFTGTAFFNLYTLFYFALVDPSSLREPDLVSPQPLV